MNTLTHNLNIERLRYAKNKKEKIPPQERFCEVCVSNHVEDEQHFITTCLLYTDLRNQLYLCAEKHLPTFNTLTTNSKFIWLMSQESPTILYNVCKYLREATNSRNTHMQNKLNK